MNKLTYLFTAFLLLALFSEGVSQAIKYKSYQWEAKPVLHKVSAEDAQKPELVLKDTKVVEFAYNSKDELEEYVLVHKIIRVNSDDAINANNKLYLPLQNLNDLILNKVRVITSKGKVTELNDKDIKEAKDERSGRTYKYFAIEGIDLGSEIEYYHLWRTRPAYTGSVYFIQNEYDKRDVLFEIIAPKSFTFEASSLNGFPTLTVDTTNTEKYVLSARKDAIKGLKDEVWSLYKPNLMQVQYKLKYVARYGKKELHTYSEASESLYKMIYAPLSKGAKSGVAKLVKSMKINAADSEEKKVRAVEDFLKSNYAVVNANIEGVENVEAILKNKYANQKGMTILFAAVYNELKIENQLVLTSSRNEARFRTDYQAYNFLDEYLLFFPNINNYVATTDLLSRLGYIPFYWSYNNALFIKPVEMGGYTTGLGKVKFIDALPADKTGEKLDVEVVLAGDDIDEASLTVKRELWGYYAQNYQPLYDFVEENQKAELDKALLNFISPNAEILSKEISNTGIANFGINPLIVNMKIKNEGFVSKAGNKFLVNIGNMIGPQAEMYQDKERKMPVENDFNRTYLRTITMPIPTGYKATNLEKLKFDVFLENDGKKTAGFYSDYKIEGGKVVVSVKEYYAQIAYPLADYEKFRKVINAAADFNKVAVVLEKK